MSAPAQPKIFHICHVDRLPSIVGDGHLWCDAEMVQRASAGTAAGTTIGMSSIKERRLRDLTLTSHPGLHVGACVPFYFSPRSVMLYLIHRGNHAELGYRGGQTPIVHLMADLHRTVAWAEAENLRWAFTLSNAGSYYFEDRADLTQLDQVNWTAVRATDWQACREPKQAEFLLERRFPWSLVEGIGVISESVQVQVTRALMGKPHQPPIRVMRDWYY